MTNSKWSIAQSSCGFSCEANRQHGTNKFSFFLFFFSVLIVYCLICRSFAKYSCGKSKCKISLKRDLSPEFRLKAPKEGVKLVYLKFRIFNESYKPLATNNRILPYRWVWARSENESMLGVC